MDYFLIYLIVADYKNVLQDTEYRIPLLCHFECHSILLHGKLFFLMLFESSSMFTLHHIYFCVQKCYFFQVCSWGGYTFIINLIPMHVLMCIVTGRFSSRLCIVYAPLVSIHCIHCTCYVCGKKKMNMHCI
jgi:hypothetical protein